MAIKETIVSGKRLRRFVNGAWERISFWHKASDCEFNDGTNAQEKLGNIKGITDSTSVSEHGYAADAKIVSDIYNSLNTHDKKFIFDYQDGQFGYNTSATRGEETFRSFNTMDKYKNIKFLYDKYLYTNVKFSDSNDSVQIKLQLHEPLLNSYKVFIGLAWGDITGYGIDTFALRPNEHGTSASKTVNYTTFYNDKSNIFTVNFTLSSFDQLNDMSKTLYYVYTYLTNFTKPETAIYDSGIIEVSLISSDQSIVSKINGNARIDIKDDFTFVINNDTDRFGDAIVSDITPVFKLDKNTLYHSGLSTSSTGSNLVWSYGQFLRKSSSSKRYKNSIARLTNEKSELNPSRLYDIDVVSFRYNDDYLPQTDQRYNVDIPGFLAEDIYEKYPIACNLDNEGRPEMWDINILFPATLKLIQEQHEDIEKLKQEIALLKSTNN